MYLTEAQVSGVVSFYNYSVRGDYITRVLDRFARVKGTYGMDRFDGIWGREYDWAFIFLGHNDTHASSKTNFEQTLVPPENVAPGYEKLVSLLRSKGIKRIIIVSPSSSNFINGVLDKVVEALTEEGKVNKSGRGLL